MRNFLIFLFITVCCAFVLYFAGSSLLEGSLRTRLKSVSDDLSNLAITIEPPSFRDLKLNSSKSLSIKEMHTTFSFQKKQLFSPEESFAISIDDATFEALDSSYKKLKLTLHNILIQSIPKDKIETSSFNLIDSYEQIKFDFISTEFESQTSNPEEATRQLLEGLAYYIKTGKLNIPIKFAGTVNLPRGDSLRLKLADNFEIERSSFDKLAGYNLSQAEINFLATRPLRAGTILELKEQSLALTKKTAGSGADNEIVSQIFYLINIKRKFGEEADIVLGNYISFSDEKRKYYLEIANEYFNKNTTQSALISIVNEQGKNFPLRSKASYKLN